MDTRQRRTSAAAAAALGGLIALAHVAFAHPAIEGGMKTPFVYLKGFAGTHIEFVADPGSDELRIYVSESEDGQLPDGKKWEWVINMTVRGKEIKAVDGKKEQVALLPLRDPGPDRKWFPVEPVEQKNGYVFYRSEVTARVLLDGDQAKRHELVFKPGKSPDRRHCFNAALKLSDAKTLRLEEVKFSVIDAAGKNDPWTKIFFQQAYGLGLIAMKKANKVGEVDMPLATYAEAISKVPEAAKFRKPEAPVL